ncbi:MAG: N-acetylneuraminate synthase [Bacteroidetes bacterium RIFCSPLOWO2_12_FULL_35_15]|nr:MAG: N-acetylneuraminate synthase [Bacteroidetes bacterium RIFCSPLOWO2_12_FULL_35_15]
MKKVYIIAEAGVNHNGSLENAKKLIEEAKIAGADAVKFQTFIPELNISKTAEKASYQKVNTGNNESQLEMVKKLFLNVDAHKEMIKHCERTGIEFLSTPFDLESIDILNDLGLQTIKIPSGEVTNFPYLKKLGKLNKRIILSTGMCFLGEIETAINLLIDAGTQRNKISLLHCNTEYPTPMEDVNLLAMKTMHNAFKLETGYSDHTLGIEIPIAAVALGATIIEKHFTLDKLMEGPDHKASLEPTELRAMIMAIRNIEKALGDGIKRPSPSESKNIAIARKSIHLIKDLPKGHIIGEGDLIMKRPGNGMTSVLIEYVIGKKLNSDLQEDHKLSWEDIL